MAEAESTPPLTTEAEVGSVIRAWARVQAIAAANANSLPDAPDITMTQMRLLTILLRRGRTHGRNLGAELGISPSSVVPLVDRLEKRVQVRRVVDRADRRITWIELTEAGSDLLDSFWQPVAACVGEAVASFTPAERETFGHLLNRVADHLDKCRPA